jgi:ParB-like chromosome segregation protein Spo0J
MTIVENLQREDLNCLEQAEAFRVLSKNFNLTQAQIAEKVGVSRESVSNYMRLLRLPHSVQEFLAAGGLGFSEAMVLLQMEDDEKIEELAAMAVEKVLERGADSRCGAADGGVFEAEAGAGSESEAEGRGAVGGSECAGGAERFAAAAGDAGEDSG